MPSGRPRWLIFIDSRQRRRYEGGWLESWSILCAALRANECGAERARANTILQICKTDCGQLCWQIRDSKCMVVRSKCKEIEWPRMTGVIFADAFVSSTTSFTSWQTVLRTRTDMKIEKGYECPNIWKPAWTVPFHICTDGADCRAYKAVMPMKRSLIWHTQARTVSWAQNRLCEWVI